MMKVFDKKRHITAGSRVSIEQWYGRLRIDTDDESEETGLTAMLSEYVLLAKFKLTSLKDKKGKLIYVR